MKVRELLLHLHQQPLDAEVKVRVNLEDELPIEAAEINDTQRGTVVLQAWSQNA